MKDNLYTKKQEVKPFCFDEKVVKVFDDMVSRSIPAYHHIIESIGFIARDSTPDGATCYDIGASTGAVSFRLNEVLPNSPIIAVESSYPMAKSLEKNINKADLSHLISVENIDAMDVSWKNSGLVVANFTLQFIEKNKRLILLKKIKESLSSNDNQSNGVLILSEKVSDENLQKMYHAYKRGHDYSEIEIEQKNMALSSVMWLDSPEEIEQRLRQAGFSEITLWFQAFNFISWIAR